jgi:hypothetical protein
MKVPGSEESAEDKELSILQEFLGTSLMQVQLHKVTLPLNINKDNL